MRFSLEATSLGWSLLEAECPAGEWMVDLPLLRVLNLVTKEVLFLKLLRPRKWKKLVEIFAHF